MRDELAALGRALREDWEGWLAAQVLDGAWHPALQPAAEDLAELGLLEAAVDETAAAGEALVRLADWLTSGFAAASPPAPSPAPAPADGAAARGSGATSALAEPRGSMVRPGDVDRLARTGRVAPGTLWPRSDSPVPPRRDSRRSVDQRPVGIATREERPTVAPPSDPPQPAPLSGLDAMARRRPSPAIAPRLPQAQAPRAGGLGELAALADAVGSDGLELDAEATARPASRPATVPGTWLDLGVGREPVAGPGSAFEHDPAVERGSVHERGSVFEREPVANHESVTRREPVSEGRSAPGRESVIGREPRSEREPVAGFDGGDSGSPGDATRRRAISPATLPDPVRGDVLPEPGGDSSPPRAVLAAPATERRIGPTTIAFPFTRAPGETGPDGDGGSPDADEGETVPRGTAEAPIPALDGWAVRRSGSPLSHGYGPGPLTPPPSYASDGRAPGEVWPGDGGRDAGTSARPNGSVPRGGAAPGQVADPTAGAPSRAPSGPGSGAMPTRPVDGWAGTPNGEPRGDAPPPQTVMLPEAAVPVAPVDPADTASTELLVADVLDALSREIMFEYRRHYGS